MTSPATPVPPAAGRGDYAPLEKEINQATKEFDKQDQFEQAKQPS